MEMTEASLMDWLEKEANQFDLNQKLEIHRDTSHLDDLDNNVRGLFEKIIAEENKAANFRLNLGDLWITLKTQCKQENVDIAKWTETIEKESVYRSLINYSKELFVYIRKVESRGVDLTEEKTKIAQTMIPVFNEFHELPLWKALAERKSVYLTCQGNMIKKKACFHRVNLEYQRLKENLPQELEEKFIVKSRNTLKETKELMGVDNEVQQIPSSILSKDENLAINRLRKSSSLVYSEFITQKALDELEKTSVEIKKLLA